MMKEKRSYTSLEVAQMIEASLSYVDGPMSSVERKKYEEFVPENVRNKTTNLSELILRIETAKFEGESSVKVTKKEKKDFEGFLRFFGFLKKN